MRSEMEDVKCGRVKQTKSRKTNTSEEKIDQKKMIYTTCKPFAMYPLDFEADKWLNKWMNEQSNAQTNAWLKWVNILLIGFVWKMLCRNVNINRCAQQSDKWPKLIFSTFSQFGMHTQQSPRVCVSVFAYFTMYMCMWVKCVNVINWTTTKSEQPA